MLKRFLILRSIDWLLFLAVLIISVMGAAIIFSLTKQNQNLFTLHLVNLLVGWLAMTVISLLDYRSWKNYGLPVYFILLIFLIAVLFAGETIFGARRWLNLGFWQFQPSEFIKVFLIITIGMILQSGTSYSFGKLLKILVYGLIPIFLVLRQPDLGTAATLSVIVLIGLIFLRIPRKIWLILLILFFSATPLIYSRLHDYQKNRLRVFFHPGSQQQDVSYNATQSKIAIGSGGLFGQGLGQGSQSQLNFLPVAHADFVFSGLAESFGFFGSLIYILVFALMLYRIAKISAQAPDRFSQFFAASCFSLFLFQAFVNIGGNLGILPITGITLPFTSYGGSSMLAMFILIGILQSIYLRHKKIRFS